MSSDDKNYFKDEDLSNDKHLLKEKFNNSNYINNKNGKELSKYIKLNNNSLLSQKETQTYKNNKVLKPLNIFSSKKPKVSKRAFPSPYKQDQNTSENKIKSFREINQIKTPSLLAQKNILRNKLFSNESKISKINSKRKIQNEKQNRNKSLVNIIHHNKHHNIDLDENKHQHDELNMIINRGKKFKRHFGKEEKCPICVALEMKNKFLEDKNSLPILKIKNHMKNFRFNKSKSPNKKAKFHNTIFENNEKLNRILSSKPDFWKRKGLRRNESAKEIISSNNRNKFENKEEVINNNKIKNVRFPCLNEYFNNDN